MKNTSVSRSAKPARTGTVATEQGAPDVPEGYDEFAAEQGLDAGHEAADDQAVTGDEQRSFSHSTTTGRAFLNAVKELPSGGFVFDMALLAGGQDDTAHRIYGSFYASKRMQRWAASQVDIKYEQGTLCSVEILNLRAVPSHGRDGKIFENYRGLLTRLTFG